MKGVFGLNTAEDLYRKLQADQARVLADPTDAFAAYDFVVTAWHLCDWRFAGKLGPARSDFCNRHIAVRVCEHLATGAKHFSPGNKHSSVSSTDTGGVWAKGVWGNVWASGVWAEWIEIELDGDARTTLGDRISIKKLAELVMRAWAEEMGG